MLSLKPLKGVRQVKNVFKAIINLNDYYRHSLMLVVLNDLQCNLHINKFGTIQTLIIIQCF